MSKNIIDIIERAYQSSKRHRIQMLCERLSCFVNAWTSCSGLEGLSNKRAAIDGQDFKTHECPKHESEGSVALKQGC